MSLKLNLTKACDDLFYLTKHDTNNLCKRFTANLIVTWNHIAYFLKYRKIVNAENLATQAIVQLKAANQNQNLKFNQATLNQLQAVFNRIHSHLGKSSPAKKTGI